jgi:hypothetical protein
MSECRSGRLQAFPGSRHRTVSPAYRSGRPVQFSHARSASVQFISQRTVQPAFRFSQRSVQPAFRSGQRSVQRSVQPAFRPGHPTMSECRPKRRSRIPTMSHAVCRSELLSPRIMSSGFRSAVPSLRLSAFPERPRCRLRMPRARRRARRTFGAVLQVQPAPAPAAYQPAVVIQPAYSSPAFSSSASVRSGQRSVQASVSFRPAFRSGQRSVQASVSECFSLERCLSVSVP